MSDDHLAPAGADPHSRQFLFGLGQILAGFAVAAAMVLFALLVSVGFALTFGGGR